MEIFGDRSKESMEMTNAYLGPIIAEAMRKSEGCLSSGKDVIEGETFLGHLIKTTNDCGYIIYCLAMYPQHLTRLRDEILSSVGPLHRPTVDDIKTMKFMRAVINETFRLFPPVPLECANSSWPSLKPDGKPLYIRAGIECVYSMFSMHRRKDLWGPDAEEYDPDRFLDDRVKTYLGQNPYIFQPFSIGPRICIGQQFPYTEISFVLIRILQSFDSITLASEMFSSDLRVPEASYRETAFGRNIISLCTLMRYVGQYDRGHHSECLKLQETSRCLYLY